MIELKVCLSAPLAESLNWAGGAGESLGSLPMVSYYHVGLQGLVLKQCGDPTRLWS